MAHDEKKGEARCRFCLDVKMQVRALSKHVKKVHQDFYVCRRNPIEYAAAEGQIVPVDPKFKMMTSKS
jgi:hypothetical protein